MVRLAILYDAEDFLALLKKLGSCDGFSQKIKTVRPLKLTKIIEDLFVKRQFITLLITDAPQQCPMHPQTELDSIPERK